VPRNPVKDIPPHGQRTTLTEAVALIGRMRPGGWAVKRAPLAPRLFYQMLKKKSENQCRRRRQLPGEKSIGLGVAAFDFWARRGFVCSMSSILPVGRAL
jgi:hypothetical protein